MLLVVGLSSSHGMVANTTDTETAEFDAKVYAEALEHTQDATPEAAPVREFDTGDEYVAPEHGWSESQLVCLNEMEDADATYDHTLNHHEYFVFADLMANRLFGMMDALTEQDEWELDELYETLVLDNPTGEMTGIDIFGASYGQLRNLEPEQLIYLKKVCFETEQALRSIGPEM